MKYRTIVADPPWPYHSQGPRAAPNHRPNSWDRVTGATDSRGRYGTLTIDAICSLRPEAESDAHLWLWTTNAFMDEAHAVARAWGFIPKTIATWGKVKPNGSPSMRTGYYLRGATEHVVFAVRGSLRFQTDDPTPTLWLWPRLPHSVKPDAFYDLVEKLSPGPYLELFARRQRLGWDTWSDEALQHVSLGTA